MPGVQHHQIDRPEKLHQCRSFWFPPSDCFLTRSFQLCHVDVVVVVVVFVVVFVGVFVVVFVVVLVVVVVVVVVVVQ